MKQSIFILIFLLFSLSMYAQSVCIDPGHGGSDPGAVGNGLKEAHINLDVGNRFCTLLKNAGYKVYMTRTSDATVSLSSRTQYANNLGVDRFISIHCNAFNGTAHGTETFCYPGVGSVTLRLRDKTNPEVVNALGTYNRGCKTADFHVLRETNMPAILCELAFIDNPNDASKLGDAYYRQRAAEALKRGFQNAGREEDAPVAVSDYYIAPQFSADGSHIIFRKIGVSDVYAVSVNGGKITIASSSPSQEQIVFVEENDLFIECNGIKHKLTNSQDIFFAPLVSPDRNWVAYQGLQTGLHLTNLLTQKTILLGQANHACWTPDSQAIVFDVSKDNGSEIISSQLQMVQVSNPNTITILYTGRKAQRPSVSPDGEKVAFDSDGKIFITNIQQTRLNTCTEVVVEK